MSTEENYDIMFKVVLVGDSFVGKTNIMSKYLSGTFKEDSKATVGVEFGSKKFVIENHSIKAQIWDTAGQERYKAITNAYYKGAKGALVVYDITNKESFASVDRWINDLTASADKKLTILLIGNKCDLEDQRQVTKDQAEEKAKAFHVAFLETSALNGQNLDKAFDILIKEVYNKCHKDIEEDDGLDDFEGGEEIELGKEKKASGEKKKCCGP